MNNKSKYRVVIIIFILLLLGFLIIKLLTKNDNDSLNEVDYYNESLFISANVFFRANSLPVKETLDEVLVIETKIIEFHEIFLKLTEPKNTQDAAEIMNRLFESCFEAIELLKKYKNGEDNVSNLMYLEKLRESQEIYLEYAKYLDHKGIPIYDTTIKRIEVLTLELLDSE